MNSLMLISFIILGMVGVLMSVTIFGITNTVMQTDKKADDIANVSHAIQKELRGQVELVQKTLDELQHRVGK